VDVENLSHLTVWGYNLIESVHGVSKGFGRYFQGLKYSQEKGFEKNTFIPFLKS
jgi:hypothetical protein